jgi:RNA polymerase sigma-70 factor, ECF subfamily
MSPGTGPAEDYASLNGSDTAELLAIAERYRPRLVACATRVLGDAEEAEDVVQDVMLRASQASGETVRSPQGWLYAICYRAAIDRRRARDRRTKLTGDAAAASGGEASANEAERRDEARRAHRALAALDDPYRTALTLRFIDGLAFAEIATQMETLPRTARTWVGRGLSTLRLRLGGRQ